MKPELAIEHFSSLWMKPTHRMARPSFRRFHRKHVTDQPLNTQCARREVMYRSINGNVNGGNVGLYGTSFYL